MTSVGSRWSCKPALGSDDSTCSITYTLGYSVTLEGLKIGEFDGFGMFYAAPPRDAKRIALRGTAQLKL